MTEPTGTVRKALDLLKRETQLPRVIRKLPSGEWIDVLSGVLVAEPVGDVIEVKVNIDRGVVHLEYVP